MPLFVTWGVRIETVRFKHSELSLIIGDEECAEGLGNDA